VRRVPPPHRRPPARSPAGSPPAGPWRGRAWRRRPRRGAAVPAGERVPQPVAAFAQVAAHRPEPPERAGQPQPIRALPTLLAPGERRAQVRVLALQAFQPHPLLQSAEPRFSRFGQGQAPGQVPVSRSRGPSSCHEALPGILAHGLQQPVADLSARLLGLRQRFVHQPAQQVQYLGGGDPFPRADRLRRPQRPAPREHREPLQQPLLPHAQQVVAPVQGRTQRPLPRQRRPQPPGQQPEAVVQAGRDTPHAQAPYPGRGQLEGQRDAV